jgi:hypothetical protein
MKTFIALLSVSLIALAVAQYGTGVTPTSTTTASTYSWTTGCAYVTSWASTPVFAYCGGCATGYYQNTAQSTCMAVNTTATNTNCVAVSSVNASACLGCAAGYYLTSAGGCTVCATGAATCTNGSYANTASPGYYLVSGVPNACLAVAGSTPTVSGCTQCDPSGNNVCISCGVSSNVNTSATNPSCSANGALPGCYSVTTASTKCDQYAPTFYGTPGSTTAGAAGTVTNCVLYGITATTCTKCATGYYVASGTTNCTVCPTVNTTSGSTCWAPPATGYFVNASTSANNSAIVAFATGVATAALGQNLTCSTGYYLTQTGLCLPGNFTDTNCAIGNSTSVCVGCKSGYYFSTNLTCGACGTNCGTCTNSSICTACSNTTLYTLNSNGTCTNKTSSANILAPSFAILSMIFYYLF